MRKLLGGLACALVFGLPAAAPGGDSAARIVGEYAEARTCDVWTGPCFANGEMNLSGDHAVTAWSIAEGSWDGVRLDGLKIAASLDSEGTFGTDSEGEVRAVVYVDERAGAAQEKALLALAKELAPRYLKDIVKVHRRPIRFERDGLAVRVQVGETPEVRLETKALAAHCDTICGNEAKFYPSLAKARDVKCAKTVAHVYRGADLGLRWSDPGARGAMVGRFEL